MAPQIIYHHGTEKKEKRKKCIKNVYEVLDNGVKFPVKHSRDECKVQLDTAQGDDLWLFSSFIFIQ